MGERYYSSGKSSGFQIRSNEWYDNIDRNVKYNTNELDNKRKEDEDLIIEDNTVYEIDRECYERLKKQRKKRNQEKKA